MPLFLSEICSAIGSKARHLFPGQDDGKEQEQQQSRLCWNKRGRHLFPCRIRWEGVTSIIQLLHLPLGEGIHHHIVAQEIAPGAVGLPAAGVEIVV